jgi:hypothetical protein
MPVDAQVDMQALLDAIRGCLCPECSLKVERLKVPLKQTITLAELFPIQLPGQAAGDGKPLKRKPV